MRNMHDDVVEVSQNPLPGLIAFHAQEFVVVLGALLHQAVGEALGMAERRRRDHDDHIHARALARHIEGHDIARLAFFKPLHKSGRLFGSRRRGKFAGRLCLGGRGVSGGCLRRRRSRVMLFHRRDILHFRVDRNESPAPFGARKPLMDRVKSPFSALDRSGQMGQSSCVSTLRIPFGGLYDFQHR